VGITVLAVAVGALVFGSYGYGMFVASPFVIGMVTAYLANRQQPIDSWDTAKLVSGALALGAAMLVVSALEGIVCIVMAAPRLLGSHCLAACWDARLRSTRAVRCGDTMSAVALLPWLFMAEWLLPPSMEFEARMDISIIAPPDSVWRALVDMQEIDTPTSLPFRLGIAYPMHGEVIGEGGGCATPGKHFRPGQQSSGSRSGSRPANSPSPL